MSTTLVLTIIAFYFAMIFTVSWSTTRKDSDSNKAFFSGERKSPWYVVAISMIGTTISGVTFISVPGMVGSTQFSYLQMVLGFTAGYILIAYILLPLYYKMNMYSIYGYLEKRYGLASYRVGSGFFIISKFLGCAVRMYLTAIVLQLILFNNIGIPFGVNVALTMLIVWLYTFRGGVKTLVWTDMLQTLSLILAVIFCIYYISKAMELDFCGLWNTITDSQMSKTFFFDDVNDKRFFWKQFLAGMFTTLAMTGLDQDMMQKNLSCKTLKDAQKNVLSYGIAFLPVNILFLSLGVLLYQFASTHGLYDPSLGLNGIKPDELFPTLATATNAATCSLYLPIIVGILFIMGLIAAAFSSAGSAITALTTSFTIDILRANTKQEGKQLEKTRFKVHFANTIVMGVLIYLFQVIGSTSVIDAVYVVASYTYGPLLGLYFFGMFTKRQPRDKWIPAICILSPILCLIFSLNSEAWFNGYKVGYELLLINGGLTALGLYLSSFRK